MAGAEPGVVGQVTLNSPNGTPLGGRPKSPAFWSWFWLGLAIFIVLGFHIRVFGTSFPPPASL